MQNVHQFIQEVFNEALLFAEHPVAETVTCSDVQSG